MARYKVIEDDSFIVDLNNFNSYFTLENDLNNFKEKNVIGLRKNSIITLENKDKVEYKNGCYYDISSYLNKFDVYRAILEYFIEKKYDANKIKSYINEDYFTFDMAIDLYSNSIKYPLPEKYKKEDFEKLIGMSKYDEFTKVGQELEKKYFWTIKKETEAYEKEEFRNLHANRDRICRLMEQMTIDLANLANNRNEVDEKVRNLK